MFFLPKIRFFAQNDNSGRKKGDCGKPPAEENGLFPRERHFWAKKGACGNPPVGGKKFRQSFRKNYIFEKKKKSACGNGPAEENGLFPQETLFLGKKRRLRQAASRRGIFLVIFCRKKAPVASRQAEGNGLFPRETLFGAKKGACGKPPVGGEKKRQNFRVFFSNFSPDLGDEFGYNRLSF